MQGSTSHGSVTHIFTVVTPVTGHLDPYTKEGVESLCILTESRCAVTAVTVVLVGASDLTSCHHGETSLLEG